MTATVFTVRAGDGRTIGHLTHDPATGWAVPGLGTYPDRSSAVAVLRINAGVDAREPLTFERI